MSTRPRPVTQSRCLCTSKVRRKTVNCLRCSSDRRINAFGLHNLPTRTTSGRFFFTLRDADFLLKLFGRKLRNRDLGRLDLTSRLNKSASFSDDPSAVQPARSNTVWRRAQLFDHVGFDDAKVILSCEFTFSSKTDGELEENERKKEYWRQRGAAVVVAAVVRNTYSLLVKEYQKCLSFQNRRLCPTTDTKMTKRRIKKRCRLTFRLFTPLLFEKMVSRALLTHTNNFPVVR